MIALLLAVGIHPVSQRPRMSPYCMRAAEILRSSGHAYAAFHVGDAQNPALRSYLGTGIEAIKIIDNIDHPHIDIVPSLVETLSALKPSHIFCGAAAENGEGSGMVPYLLAEALNMPVLPGVIALEGKNVWQASSNVERRLYRLTEPTILVAAKQQLKSCAISYAKARAGKLQVIGKVGAETSTEYTQNLFPARQRPLIQSRAQTTKTSREPIIGLTPAQAALQIKEFINNAGFAQAEE